mgnify:CR=1 FL=1
MPPARRFDPVSGKGPCPLPPGRSEGRIICAQASGIVSEINRLRCRETRADKTLSQIRAVDCNDRNGAAIRRRRLCVCGARFTTFERVQFRELMVVKKNGRKSSFDRDKLSKSIYIALKKRPIDTETIEKFISNISRSLEELGQSEISTNTIGTMVMDGLKDLDPVGYVRFASVYRNFREEKDFVQFVDKLDVYKKR